MNKIILKRVIYGVFLLAWMIIIFCFSSQQSEQSSGTSEKVIKAGLSKTENFKKLDAAKQKEKVEKLQHPIRKLAHFTEYTIGGVIIFNFINTFQMKTKKKLIYALLIGILYATTDEFHQLFIDGRSGQFTDVLIDSSGVLLGTTLSLLISKKFNIFVGGQNEQRGH